MDLRDATQELYAVMPRDFTAARTALARQAKDRGDKDLAQQIGSLPKPAAGAWAINMLAVHKPEVIDGVVRFGHSLRAAQEEADAAAFRELGQQRQGQLTSAVHAAKDLAGGLGAPLSAAAAADVEQTLRAAMADTGAAAAVATGRLVRGLSGSGFESVDLTDAVAAAGPDDIPENEEKATGKSGIKPPRKASPPAKEPTGTKKKEAKEEATSLAERRAAKQQAALKEARSDFEAANKLAQSAEDAASKAWELVNELADRRTTLKSAIDEARNRLAKLEAELIGLTRDADAAESGKKLAVRAAAQQRRAADQAQRRVDRLS
ncbi:hypothetical protein CQ020_21885 [Arthrobacter sp. MYb23]|uniref:hypothetical protein n=1 Tax=unclassified Arthrobacter TaxID=235627 RepID=UPI000CFB8BE6|nr:MULTISPECIES: hypothetical protein [unclassified Arthrobacter]PRB41824.1 hypothetical protein CQ038_11885 [Arthrobacter sp. MYb51]PRB90148.1 hypothetical protein CQ020_21885 [Arthrobacter sp. MYb23]